MRLSLLKAATYPDSKQDMERHTFSFGLLPHLGTLADSAVVHVARIFNNPAEASQVSAIENQDELGLLASPATAAAPIQLADAEASTVVLDTLKRGEQDFDYYGKKGTSGKTVVVRLYEVSLWPIWIELQPDHEDEYLTVILEWIRCLQSSGAFAKTALRVALPVKKIALTNLLEDELQSWSPSDAKLKKKQRAAAADAEEGEALDVKVNADGTTTVQLDFRAFEIKTLKFHLA